MSAFFVSVSRGDFSLGTCFDNLLPFSILLYIFATDFSISAKFCIFLRIPFSSLRGPESTWGASGAVKNLSLVPDERVDVKEDKETWEWLGVKSVLGRGGGVGVGKMGENEGGGDGAGSGGGGGGAGIGHGDSDDFVKTDGCVGVKGKDGEVVGGGQGGGTFGGSGMMFGIICSLSTVRNVWHGVTPFLAKGGVGFRVGGGEISSEQSEGVIRIVGNIIDWCSGRICESCITD